MVGKRVGKESSFSLPTLFLVWFFMVFLGGCFYVWVWITVFMYWFTACLYAGLFQVIFALRIFSCSVWVGLGGVPMWVLLQ